MRLSSSSISNGWTIPHRFPCEGEGGITNRNLQLRSPL